MLVGTPPNTPLRDACGDPVGLTKWQSDGVWYVIWSVHSETSTKFKTTIL